MKKFGFDLDNTLIDYSESCRIYSKLHNLPNLNSIDALRSYLKPNISDSKNWTLAQSWIYGEGLRYAKITDGSLELLLKLEKLAWQYQIFSLKTEFTPDFTGNVPLRAKMIEWISKSELRKYFNYPYNIEFFESIDKKVSKITASNINIYVDDHYKVITHPNLKVDSKYLFKAKAPDYPEIISIDKFSEIKVD